MSYDITTGEIGKVIRLNLEVIDESQNPPATVPLLLTNAASVTLQYAFGSIFVPVGTLKQVAMSIVDAINGIVQYVTVTGDLDAPAGFPFTGKIEYAVKVVFNDGSQEYSSDIGVFLVKEKVGT